MSVNAGSLILPLGAAIAGNLLYHLASRGASGSGTPFATLAVVYLMGCIAAAILAVSVESAPLKSFGDVAMRPATLLLAAAVLMIEVGFLYAYRAGAPISSSSLLVNATVAVVLAGVGFLWYKESADWRAAAGLALTVTGVLLLASSRASAP